MRAVIKTREERNLKLTLGCSLLLGLFLLACIHQKLAGDVAAGKWQSMITRIGIVGLCSFLLAWRLDLPRRLSFLDSPRSAQKLAVVVMFLAVFFYPLSSHFTYFTTSVSQVAHEITKNTEGPVSRAFALLKSFPKEYGAHTDEHFVLPKLFVHLDALVKIYVLGVSPNNNVAVGKNGFYFEGWGARKVEKGIVENFDNIADYMGQIPFSEDQLRTWKRTLEERKYWLKEQGVDYLFALAPTKALVYPEYLPANLQTVDKGRMRYDQLSSFLQHEADVAFIDLRQPLLEAKEKRRYPLLFYKTDFHWNFYGAFIVYQAVMERLSRMLPQYHLAIPKFSEFDVVVDEHWAHHRFMDMIGLPAALHKNEHYITMVPKPGGRYDAAGDLPPEGIHDVYPPEREIRATDGSSMKLRLIENPEAPMRSILLLGDSFLEKCVYFFSADARRVINYRTIVNFPAEILRYEKPDIVIQEILNMFILRPPPENPAGFAASYLRGKFAENEAGTILRLGPEHLPDTITPAGGPYTVDAVLEEGATPYEVRVGKISLSGPVPTHAVLRYFGTAGNEVKVNDRDVARTGSDIYFTLPPIAISRLTIEFSDGGESLPALRMLEIRSDRR